MLKVDHTAHGQLVNALLHAITCGVEEQFVNQLKYLHCYMSPPGRCDYSMCALYKDFAPHSFSFSLWTAKLLEEKGSDAGYLKLELGEDGGALYDRPILHGGLIYHPGATGPDQSLSVELNGDDKPHWSVHT